MRYSGVLLAALVVACGGRTIESPDDPEVAPGGASTARDSTTPDDPSVRAPEPDLRQPDFNDPSDVDDPGDTAVPRVNRPGVPLCGDGVIEDSEQCDGFDLNYETCSGATMGSAPGGTLRCTDDCTFDTSSCFARRDPPPIAISPDCERYCDEISLICDEPYHQYDGVDDCLRVCPSFERGSRGDLSGNTLDCRIAHIGLAGADPQTHCVHAGASGGGACE